MDDIEATSISLEKEIKLTQTLDDLLRVETNYLGRHGRINNLLNKMKNLVPDERKKFGQGINSFKTRVNFLINKRRQELFSQHETGTYTDVTLPGDIYPKGSVHLISVAIEEISRIFEKIGFIRVSYPEVEYEFFSFESLNMPKSHAARDDFETSFIEAPNHSQYGKMLLTPHTSSGQVREMWRVGTPPIRMINLAKTYRPNWDATHTPMFFQFEGLCVDTDINITHLKGTLTHFVKEYFGEDIQMRLRPHHFQFTEPSFEVDVTCTVCKGSGQTQNGKCKVCKSGWLELGGTGMTHPNVLKAGKIDPLRYSGWAFGFGIERVIMMKYGIDDIRNYYSGDIRFLEQF